MVTATYNSERKASQETLSTGTSARLGNTISILSDYAVRYSIVLVLVWIGAMKFTAYEAGAIEGLVASSPFLAWLYTIASQQTVSNLIGTFEITTAVLLALGLLSRKAALIGALGAVAVFLTTFSFVFTAPGWEQSLGGFPALSVVPGQFLLKDIVLLAASVSLLGRAITDNMNR